MIELLIVDDHTYIREGIKNILKNNKQIIVRMKFHRRGSNRMREQKYL